MEPLSVAFNIPPVTLSAFVKVFTIEAPPIVSVPEPTFERLAPPLPPSQSVPAITVLPIPPTVKVFTVPPFWANPNEPPEKVVVPLLTYRVLLASELVTTPENSMS